MHMPVLEQFAQDIWVANGPPVNFYGMDYPIRMTIIKLVNGDLFVHSPISPTPEILQEVVSLGEVKFIISPNKIHHIFLGDWADIFPESFVYASPGLLNKRPELSFDGELGDVPETDWSDEIDQLIFSGSRVMDEVVFFHKASKTLILADLIENFEKHWFKGWRGILAKFAGIVAPNGKTPIDYRLSFFGNKKIAREKLGRILKWHPENIIIAHGICFKGNAMAELKRAFGWLS